MSQKYLENVGINNIAHWKSISPLCEMVNQEMIKETPADIRRWRKAKSVKHEKGTRQSIRGFQIKGQKISKGLLVSSKFPKNEWKKINLTKGKI